MFSFIQSLSFNSLADQDPESVMADYVMRKNKRALSALYDRYADDLCHYLLTFSKATLAQDIVQKTRLKLVEKPTSYQHSSSDKAFLFNVDSNTLLDEIYLTVASDAVKSRNFF